MMGFLRATEVTRNELMDTYHPHIHVLLFVSPTYFKNKENYISQDEWTELWKKSAKLDYYPIVDVRAIKPKNEKTSDIRSAILEKDFIEKDKLLLVVYLNKSKKN